MNAKRLLFLLASAGVASASVVAFSRDLQVVGASAPPNEVKSEHHQVVIAGGGTGGVTVAAQLRRKLNGKPDIVIVDAAKEHYYQPAWTLVGGGLYEANDTIRPLESVIPEGVQLKRANIAKFDPDSNQVQLTDGTTLSYDYLVVATGIETRWPVPGTGDGNSFVDGVCSIYAGPAQAARTYVMITGIKAGDSVIFTQPPTPIKCGGAPQKIAYLADDYLRRKGIRSQVDISFIIPQPKIFPASAHYNTALEVVAESRNIKVETGMELAEAKLSEGKALFKKTGTQGPLEERKCNFLHIVPHMGPPAVVRCSKLSNPASGYCDVDKGTLQHVRYPNVFSLGDSAGLPTSKTAAAISSQAPVLVHNLIQAMQSKSTNAIYDGYTSCPIITGKDKLILAEFKYEGLPKESFGSFVDQRKEYAVFAYMKRFLFPRVYWSLFLTGRWYGPNGLLEPKFPEK